MAKGKKKNTVKKAEQPKKGKMFTIGDELPDGWIFLGVSPLTGQAYSLEPPRNITKEFNAYFHHEEKHIPALEKKGFVNVRFPSDGDEETSEWVDIFNKIVLGGRNDKAKLHTIGFRESTYWTAEIYPSAKPIRLVKIRSLFGKRPTYWEPEHFPARGRCVRDEPELTVRLTEARFSR